MGIKRAAVALSFDESERSPPKVELHSEYLAADQIVSLAHQYGIPVVRRGSLSSILSELPLDTVIPPELYEVVATLIVEIQSFRSNGS